MLVLLVSIGISGCASGPSNKHPEAHARLDSSTSVISLPLDSFAMNWSELQLIGHANAIVIDRCMRRAALTFPQAEKNWDTPNPLPNRRYGVWSRTDAENNGYDLEETEESKRTQALEESLPPEWWNRFSACRSTEKMLPSMGMNTSPQRSVVDNGARNSYDSVLSSAEFRSIRDEWSACARSAGLSIDTGSALLMPQLPESREEKLSVAARDVDCKESLHSMQRISDMEARFQLDYIDAHEAELKEYRSQVEDVLREARMTISSAHE